MEQSSVSGYSFTTNEHQSTSLENKTLELDTIQLSLNQLVEGLRQKQSELNNSSQKLQQEKERFEKERIEWEEKYKKVYSVSISEVIKLNVGGKSFSATRRTLTSVPGSFFEAMFSGRFPITPDSDGAYFIDRNPKVFSYVLDFLRGSTLQLQNFSESKWNQLYDDADFYQIDSLKKLVEIQSTLVAPKSQLQQTRKLLVNGSFHWIGNPSNPWTMQCYVDKNGCVFGKFRTLISRGNTST
eukprot:TRINITY_DN4875_c0_g1_i1.p1 TRINITY_DN4875_c0_g1~~TRINITY_DN4875_c0_g1_i1.p1  ORF type:complete len:241 (-),score=29.06 TRINITY_DN4875_c0_g1_i1:1310-2032(-)